MSRALSSIRFAFAVPAVVTLASCSDQRAPTEATARVPSVAFDKGDGGPKHAGAIIAHDSCEPNSFNLATGPGSCVKNGRTTFAEFIAELTATQVVRDWRFTPEEATGHRGVDVLGHNVGGEEHTFTPVSQYGGGIVDLLNQLSGNPVPAQECLSLDEDDFVPSGGKYPIEAEELSEVADASGIARVQCCIHPWMRSVVQLKR